jgi:hypothetical protein
MSIDWFNIRKLGNSKIVSSNYLWLFIIPFLANNIDKLAELLGIEIQITFSVARLFYASLFFVIGTLVYQIRCPDLIKEHLNFTDFDSAGKTSQHVVDYLQLSANQYKSSYSVNDIKVLIEKFDCDEECEGKKLVVLISEDGNKQSLYIDNELQMDFFWDAYSLINKQFHKSKLIVYFTYAISIGFLVITAIGNTYNALVYFWCN